MDEAVALRDALPDALPDELGAVYAENRRFLWGLCYRMTGSVADADDLVQDTFARALSRPPADTSRPWRPWLTRVAMNLGRDHLRRRRRIRYEGPWLPSPLETEPVEAFVREEERAFEPACTEGRYELLESVSMAFLVALEALTPAQRAVLLLRDVLGYSGSETAEALEMSEANVRQTLHRARRTMEGYDRSRVPNTAVHRSEMREALVRFMGHLLAGDVAAIETLLAEDVVALNDAGGEFFAARVPVVGRNKVARFHTKIAHGGAGTPRIEIRHLNGLPAVVGEFEGGGAGFAPRFAVLGWSNPDGRIARVLTVLARRKLVAIAPLQRSRA
jgi:RNA polymerase sigma factor (sigma-70 family)